MPDPLECEREVPTYRDGAFAFDPQFANHGPAALGLLLMLVGAESESGVRARIPMNSPRTQDIALTYACKPPDLVVYFPWTIASERRIVFWHEARARGRSSAVTDEIRTTYNQLLEGIARELDIPPSKYRVAVERYTSVGTWLEGGQYAGSQGVPYIYPQGSFRLGTVVRPIVGGTEADYDIDLVCQLQVPKGSSSPGVIKTTVGDRIKENSNYQRMLAEEGRRCWTLEYAENDGIGFHLDVLPASPEEEAIVFSVTGAGVPVQMANKAIAITNRDGDAKYSWSSSNPNGFADWFDEINRPVFQRVAAEQKTAILESDRSVFAKVDDVPDQLVRTPLQRAIQILKRHRDLRFVGHEAEADKPISMVLTVLSASLYGQEGDTLSTLQNIVAKLGARAKLLQPGASLDESVAGLNLIERRADGTWLIRNPVNPAENFADRWHENNDQKARAFFAWVGWVRTDLLDVLMHEDAGILEKSLEPRLGQRVVEAASRGVYVAAAPALVSSRSQDVPLVHIKGPSKPWGFHA